MAKSEEKNLTDVPSSVPISWHAKDKSSTQPKFKSTRSKSSRELFYIVTALAGLIRIVMQFVHR